MNVQVIPAPASERISNCLEYGRAICDSALEKFERGELRLGMEEIFVGMHQLREVYQGEEWERFAKEHCRQHPVTEWVHQDPLTWRTYEKPRGYAGDAVMLDYIYSPDTIPAGTSDVGTTVFSYTADAPAARSVRARASMIASQVDAMAATRPIRVLSVACGHMREARFSRALKGGKIAEYVAFDQDEESLQVVRDSSYGPNMRTIQGDVRSLIVGKVTFSDFDYVYSAGLYDYLNDRLAQRLTSRLFDAVAPGGRLVIPNFAPDLFDIAYMETFMDWELIYRDEADMARLVNLIPAEQIASRKIYRDVHRNIVFLEIEKVG